VWFPKKEDKKKLASYLLTIENKARYDLRLYLKAIVRPVLVLLNINVLSN